VPGWIDSIDGIMIAVEVRTLVEFGVTSCEAPDLCVIVSSSYARQPRIAIVSVAALRREHVRVRAAARARDLVAEAVHRQRAGDCLCAAGDRSFAALPIKERRFAILSYQRVTVGIRRGGRTSLLFEQDCAAIVQEAGRRCARRAAQASVQPVVCVAGDVGALRDARLPPVIVESDGVRCSAQCPARLLTVGVVGIGVDEAACRTRCAVELVVVVEREGGRRRAFGLAGAVAHTIDDVGEAVGISARSALRCQAAAPIVTVGYHIPARFGAGLTAVVGIVDIAERRQHRRSAVFVGDARQVARVVVGVRSRNGKYRTFRALPYLMSF